jgi:hypothetical protein
VEEAVAEPLNQEFSMEAFVQPEEAMRPVPAGHTLVVRASSPQNLALAERALRTLGRTVIMARAAKQAERIDRLVEAIIEDEPLSAIDEALEVDNAALRARYLETVPTYTATELHAQAGSAATNRSALAFGWKKEGRVFAIPYKGTDRFPAFQFADGRPRAAIRRVLRALPEGMTPWQVAFWFASGNGWLEGAAPQDRLDEVEAVTAAAERMRHPAVG